MYLSEPQKDFSEIKNNLARILRGPRIDSLITLHRASEVNKEVLILAINNLKSGIKYRL